MASAPFFRTSSRVSPSLRSMCRSETGTTTWICGVWASLIARQTASISSRSARASAVTATLRISRNTPAGVELAGRGARETGFDDVHAQLFELPGDAQLGGGVQVEARRLLAI